MVKSKNEKNTRHNSILDGSVADRQTMDRAVLDCCFDLIKKDEKRKKIIRKGLNKRREKAWVCEREKSVKAFKNICCNKMQKRGR